MLSESDIATKKEDSIINILLMNDAVRIDVLHALSRLPGGFLTNSIRSAVWPKLLCINRFAIEDYRKAIESHVDEKQVQCDIERSLWNYSQNQSWTEEYRNQRRVVLTDIIISILCKHPSIYYYQGFHDIIGVFIQVIADDSDQLSYALSEAVTIKYFADCMLPDFQVIATSLSLLMTLLSVADVDIYELCTNNYVEPFFALSWIITWFSHDVDDLNEIARIYDALLCSPPCYALYLSVALLVFHRETILACDEDFGSIHNLLVHLPSTHGMPIDLLLPYADKLLALVPPSTLLQLANNKVKKLAKKQTLTLLNDSLAASGTVTPDWKLLVEQSNNDFMANAESEKELETPTTITGSSYVLPVSTIISNSYTDTYSSSNAAEECNLTKYRWLWGNTDLTSTKPAMPTWQPPSPPPVSVSPPPEIVTDGDEEHGEASAASPTEVETDQQQTIGDVENEPSSLATNDVSHSIVEVLNVVNDTIATIATVAEANDLVVEVTPPTDVIVEDDSMNVVDEPESNTTGIDRTIFESTIAIANLSETENDASSQKKQQYAEALSDDDWDHVGYGEDNDNDSREQTLSTAPTSVEIAAIHEHEHVVTGIVIDDVHPTDSATFAANAVDALGCESKALSNLDAATTIAPRKAENEISNDAQISAEEAGITAVISEKLLEAKERQESQEREEQQDLPEQHYEVNQTTLSEHILRISEYYKQNSTLCKSLQAENIQQRIADLLAAVDSTSEMEGDEDSIDNEDDRDLKTDKAVTTKEDETAVTNPDTTSNHNGNIIFHLLVPKVFQTRVAGFFGSKLINIGSTLLVTAVLVAGISYGVQRYRAMH